MQPSEPAEQAFPNCSIKSIVCHAGLVYVAMVNNDRQLSELVCANTGQALDVPGRIESMVVCSSVLPAVCASAFGLLAV